MDSVFYRTTRIKSYALQWRIQGYAAWTRLSLVPGIDCPGNHICKLFSASALPGKMGKHENHIFTQLDCVTHTMHLCAVFLKEKVVISDVFDSM